MARRDWLEAGAVAAALFALYALSAPRTIALEDDALFVLSSYFLGIEHPPGYPLFTLVGHLFSQLPLGSVAYRVHLAAAFFGAAGCATAWLCARELGFGRLPAHLAALALGVSPVFWSQSIIAEVYTLNVLFFLLLTLLSLKRDPPLPWIAFLFGLSLSNHWPLMLLVAPAFAVLLWPRRAEILRRAWLLAGLAAAGLLPYAWLVLRSLQPLPISFYGPLDSLAEIWYFVSRAGYAEIDRTPSAGWIDRLKFLRFFATELALQFALLGTALAAVGFSVQWQRLGRRVSAFLTIAFLMPSVVLLFLLRFDYSSISKHVFHVYPLPSYAVAALWLGLGFAHLAERYALRRAGAAAAATALVALVFALGAYTNVFVDHGWGARYARTLLAVLPRDAAVFGRGEADLATMAYFHMVEGVRPDITLYATRGLVLGNRLFKPTRTSEETRQRILRETVERESAPVAFTLESFSGYARVDRWLYTLVDKSSRDARQVKVDIPPEAMAFFERDVAQADHRNAWIAFFQAQLRRRYGEALARSLPRGAPADARVARHLELLTDDFYGALGVAEGLMLNPHGYSVGEVSRVLERARQRMPADAAKDEIARYFQLRAAVRASVGDEVGAIRDFETSLEVWPRADNAAIRSLEALYVKAGNSAALENLRRRYPRP